MFRSERDETFTSLGGEIMILCTPLFTLFTFRMKKGMHQIIIDPPREVKASSRSERNKALQASAQLYADALEESVRQHPFQWYIFEPFFGSASAATRKSEP